VVSARDTELRELTADERASYFRAMQGLWGGGLAEEAFVAFQRRLASSPEAAGRYRMFGLFPRGGGVLLSGVKAYDLAGAFEGAPLRILGIGAVFTPPGLRGRGYAARMLNAALARFGDEGADAALLFSDIGAEYYRRLGFHALQSAECFAEGHQLPRSNGYRTAVAADEEPMCRLFELARGRERLSLSRDGWTLRFQLRRLRELSRARNLGEPEWGVMVEGASGEAAAMVRLSREAVDVLDAAWTSDGACERLLGGLRDLLVRAGRPRLRLWPASQLRGRYAEGPRTGAIAMIAPLRAGVALPAADEPAEFSLLDHI
jgi:GNAT superfamily N-acetyltransferase